MASSSPRKLTYAECQLGAHVAIGDVKEVRDALVPFEEEDAELQPLEQTVLRFAGRRGTVSKRATSNLVLLEMGGRVGVKLEDDGSGMGGEALLPVLCLCASGVEVPSFRSEIARAR